MALYIVTCLGLSLLAVSGGGTGDPLVMIAFPPFTGYYLGVGRKDRALGLIATVFIVCMLASGSIVLALAYGFAAAAGAFFARGWTFGKATAAVATVLCALVLGMVAAQPQEVLDSVVNQFNTLATMMTPAGEEVDREAIVEATKQLTETLPYTGLGSVCGMILMLTTLCGALLARRFRAVGCEGQIIGRFRDARTPDWLVWVAIGLAVAWFIDDRWPYDALRLVTWNTAILLVFVYWLNGFGVLLYGLEAFKVTGIWYYLPLVLVFMPQSGASMVLPMVGLFDTWWEMRQRFDKIASQRKDNLD